jgi:vacuolar iron transporter family protein
LLSTASLVVGVASGNSTRSVILLTGVAAAVAGALSMAIGEFGSVSSQRDAELADLELERQALAEHPEVEINELASIYRRRGLPHDLARTVAVELHRVDPLSAHARDELGLDPDNLARPLEAALVSAGSFAIGAAVPVFTMAMCSAAVRGWVTVAVTMVGLALLGATGAGLGGASRRRGAIRVLTLGAAAMLITSLVGRWVGRLV